MIPDDGMRIRKREIVIASLISFLTAIVFMFESPLDPFIRYMKVDTDSAVSRTVAYMMYRGYAPYKDTFDHKGPLIFIVNYIGDYVISDRFGLWLIEVVLLAVSALFMYLTSRLILNRSKSCIVALTSFSVLLLFFYPGNFVEEFAVPFIAISNYIFIDYLVYSRLGAKKIIICGFCLGAVLMLKPNMISLWIVFCIVILIRNIRMKTFKELFRSILLFLTGVVLMVIPILLWLYHEHALSAFWNDYITFNFSYASSSSARNVVRTFMFFATNPVICVSLVSIAVIATLRKDKTAAIVFAQELLSITLVSVSDYILEHYGLIIIPGIVYPLGRLILEINEIPREKVRIWVDQILVLVFFFSAVFPGWIALLIQVHETYKKGDFYFDVYDKESFDEIVRVIDEKTTRDDKISVFGNMDSIYLSSDRAHATDYSYQDPIGFVNPELMHEYYEQLEDDMPKLIIVQEGHYNQIGPFLENNGYELIWPTDTQNSSAPAAVYELNQPTV